MVFPGVLSTYELFVFFSHPDFTVGSGILMICTISHRISRITRVADFTAGREFQLRRSPCPEEFSFIWLYYITNFIIMQYKIKKIWNAAGVFCIPFIFFTSKCQLERTPVIIIWIWFAWENSSKYRNVQVFALIQKMLLFEHLWCEFSIFCIVLSKVLYFLIL